MIPVRSVLFQNVLPQLYTDCSTIFREENEVIYRIQKKMLIIEI